MFKYLVALAAAVVLVTPTFARIEPFSGAFHSQMVQTNGTTLYVRVGGQGPAVILLHGFGDTGDMWAPLAAVLVKDHTVIVPDLRGMGLSAHPDSGYTKKNQAVDIDTETRNHYAALYAKPHAMHDAFEQFGAFSQDAIDNKALLAHGGKLTMPVLGVGGEKSFGPGMADELRFVADNVSSGIVPHSGHWIMEENPQATVKIVTEFLAK